MVFMIDVSFNFIFFHFHGFHFFLIWFYFYCVALFIVLFFFFFIFLSGFLFFFLTTHSLSNFLLCSIIMFSTTSLTHLFFVHYNISFSFCVPFCIAFRFRYLFIHLLFTHLTQGQFGFVLRKAFRKYISPLCEDIFNIEVEFT